MLKSKRLLSCVLCFVMLMVGIPLFAEESLSEALIAQDQTIFQQADPNEISATLSTPTAWKQQGQGDGSTVP